MVGLRRDGIERRDAILDAALECYCEQGLLGTGIEEIRRRAKASPSSIYHFFDDANAITLALLTRTFERLFSYVAARVVRTKTAKKGVETLVVAHLDWVFAHPSEARFMYQATALELRPEDSEALVARKAELMAPLLAHVGPFIERGEIPAWSPIEHEVVLLGPSHEACRRLLAGAPLTKTWMRATLPRLAWNSIAREAERSEGEARDGAETRRRHPRRHGAERE